MPDDQSNDSAKEDGELFRQLVSHLTDCAMFVCDRHGVVQGWNVGAEHLFGYVEREIIGRSLDCFFTPEDLEAGVPQQEMEAALHTGIGPDDRWHVRKDGSRFWGSGLLTPVRDAAGEVCGFAKILRDRTTWKQQQDAAEDSRRRQEARVTAILDTALDCRATIVARAVEMAQPLLDAHEHRLEIATADESLLVDADAVRLTQVVTNLLINAAKYTETGGQIHISAARQGGQAVLRVRDNGIGIAPDVLPHVFDLFVQGKAAATRSPSGLGVGLTLVRNLVDMHGGTVEAGSAGIGAGAEFTVRLPLITHAHEEGPKVRDTAHVSSTSQRILVVDDNADAADSLAALIRMQGHEVRVAHDGRSALDTVRTYRPSLIFLDIGMPEMDGHEVARRLRGMPGMKHTVLAALTGWGQPEDRRRSEAAGFDHHLVKPMELHVLDDLLDGLSRPGPLADG